MPPSAPRLSKRALQGANQAAAHDLTRGAIYPRSAKTPNFCARLKKKVQQSNDAAQIYIQPIAPFAAHGTNQQNFKKVIVIFFLMPYFLSILTDRLSHRHYFELRITHFAADRFGRSANSAETKAA